MATLRGVDTLTGNSLQTTDFFRKRIENFSFLLSDRIGRGFSSTVYRGLNELTHEIVAIKVIDLKSLRDDIAKSMLESELACIKTLSHPNLLKCYAHYTTVNNCYIITEFCNEGDLASKLKAKGKYSEDEFKPVFRQIFQGYCKLNELGYLHRDLKPANILLRNGVIKIADFGFVRKHNGRIKEAYNVGTPLYMSPEAMKDNIYTPKNDIWSLGVMSYELLAGKAPWECRNEAELKDKMARNCIKFDGLDVSADLKDLLQRCLEMNEAKRISLEEIEKHPWVRRLMNPIQLDTTRVPVPPSYHEAGTLTIDGQLTRATSNHLRRCQRLPDAVQNPEASDLHTPDKNRDPLSVLVSMLNFCRFNFKVQQMLRNCSSMSHRTAELLAYLQSDLLAKMNLHDFIIHTKNNIVQMSGWNDFLESDGWNDYCTVVETYNHRYNLRHVELKRDGRLKKLLREFIREMNASMDLHAELCSGGNVVMLDYLVTYYLLTEMWEQLSGDYQAFAENSHVDQISCGRVDESRLNKHEVYERLRQRIALAKI